MVLHGPRGRPVVHEEGRW